MPKQKKTKTPPEGVKRSKGADQELKSVELSKKNDFRLITTYGLPVVAVLLLWLLPQSSNILSLVYPSSGHETVQDLASLGPAESSVRGDLEEFMQYPSCRFVMSESHVGGWGIFSLVDLKLREKILPSDIRIQLVDLPPKSYEGLHGLLEYYAWGSKIGRVEGTEVHTIVPGTGMLSNGWDSGFQAVAGKPDNAEPGEYATRGTVGAGSFSHYHNKQFYSMRPVSRGDEILVNYGSKYTNVKLDGKEQFQGSDLRKPMNALKEKGLCLDNIANDQAQERGRGAFATRLIPKNSLVAPLPLLPVNRTSLDMDDEHRKQLLLNYCFGHRNSTLLLFPYAPVVNYINSVNLGEEPNAAIQWSDRAWNLQESHNMSAQDILSSFRWGLLLEVVALQDIQPGAQVLVDYGRDWHQAWSQHVQTFNDALKQNSEEEKDDYIYPSRMNQLATVRTIREQEDNPYPTNVETSCIYQYQENIDHPQWSFKFDKRNKVTYTDWPSGRNEKLVPDFLRPCRILARDDDLYTVEVTNTWAVSVGPEGRIPRGVRHVVTNMPRSAIEFTDRRYSTDQNLPNAFRQEIGLPDGLFPTAWMDLSN